MAIGLAATCCQAGFVLVEDFNGLTNGPVNGQHGWVGSGTDGRVVTDPADAANRVLAATNNVSANIYHALGSLTLPNTNTSTLFFRMRQTGTALNCYAGLSDVAVPATSADYEVNLRYDTSNSGKLKAKDASNYDIIETTQSNVWYQVWMVVNNPRKLYAVYFRGGVFTNQVQLNGDSDGETWFSFRSATGDGFNTNSNPQATALVTFLVKTASGHAGPVYLDDIYVDPAGTNLTSPLNLPDTNPPVVLTIDPPAGSILPSLSAITVTFNESVTNVTAAQLLVNGVAATNVSGADATWTWQMARPPAGTATVRWAANPTITDLATNRFPGTNTWTYTITVDTVLPDLLAIAPAPGAVLSNLSRVAVTFSKAVVGVNAADLLVNSLSALSVTNSGNTYYFAVAPPPPGSISVGFDSAHGITDLAGNRFDETAAGHSWSYTLVDATPPAVTLVTPAPGATVARLNAIQILFSEPVTGVDARDLLINGAAATNVTGFGLGPYVFSFPQPPLGTVSFSWAPGNGITDLAPLANALAGGSWSNILASPGRTGSAIINEFLTANISTGGLHDEDGELEGWIELFNPGTNAVNLNGWSLTDDATDPGKWTFPSVVLAPGQFLVVFASGKDRRVVGGAARLHTSFTLSPYGDYLALCPPDFPQAPAVQFAPNYLGQRNDYSYGLNSSGQWRYYSTPTPGAPNGDSAVTNSLGPVHFTVEHGVYNAPFTLTLVPPLPAATIRYTTDGSVPGASNGADYLAPLVISNTTTLRAAAFLAGNLPSLPCTHTYIFPASVVNQPADPPGFPITTLWNDYGWPAEYGMNPTVVYDRRYVATLTNDLLAIPSLSIVMNVDDIFGAANGIYTHANSIGPAWERACSVEFINPDGSQGFQCDAGIQMHGGGSRARTQKHPFRVQFKGKYGPTKLNYQIFPDSPLQEFDTIDLRSDYNNHWTHGSDVNQRSRGTLVRDAWYKDLQSAMGGLSGHTRFVHLYINGLYWGVYNPCERPDGDFGAAYLGGQKEDYDAFNGSGLQLVDGNAVAHNTLTSISSLQSLAQYELMKHYLDVVQYADYMILEIYGANQDWGAEKNWYCLRQRVPGAGFKYLCWDNERVLEATNQLPMGVSSAANLNTVSPDSLQAKLVASPEYRLLFADRVQKHFFNGGVLTSNAILASWQARAAQIDRAIVAESARWGAMMTTVGRPSSTAISPVPYPGYNVGAPYTRDDNWLGEQNRLFTNYFPARAGVVLDQLRVAGLYPTNVMAPVFSRFGGRVLHGFALTLSSTNQIYFTTNGLDPRVYGSGVVSGFATPYTNGMAITLNASATVKARALQGTTNWSALVEAGFVVEQLGSSIRIVELMHNPAGGSTCEFLELLNTGSAPVDLGGYSFDGISFLFPAGSSLAGGGRLVLANNGNPSAWALRYPGVIVAGWYGGNLSNSGERIALLDPSGRTICSVTYGVTNGWPASANGLGYSLEIVDPQGDPNDSANWRASASIGGTPGQPPAALPAPNLLLNELMAENSGAVSNGLTCPDWLELFNPTTNSVNLTGWSLTINGDSRKYVFTNAPPIDPGQFLVVWCDSATNAPGFHTGFTLGRKGESVFLFDPQTNLVDAVSFGLQLTNYSLGRVQGSWQLTVPTPATNNLPAVTGTQTNLVLNEWLANSSPGGSDWIELFNRSAFPVPLNGLYFSTSNELFQLCSQSFIAPGGFVQLFADKSPGSDHLDFKLSAEDGAIILYDSTGLELDHVTYAAQTEGVSQGRFPDGASNTVTFTSTASPGASNYLPTWTGPVLNEVLAINHGAVTNLGGRMADFVELFNAGDAAFDLSGFGLSTDLEQPAQWVFPPGTTVPGNGYLTVWFGKDWPASTNAGPLLNTGHSLDGHSGAAYLFNPAGQIADSVLYGFQIPDLSIGRSGGAWRLLSAPTPGAPNAAPATLGPLSGLRLNEWMANPASGDDWFELFNSSAQPADLAGLFLTDDPSIPDQRKFQVPWLSFIGPLGFVCWQADGHPGIGRDHVSFQLSSLGEALCLYDTNLALLDAVNFGLQQPGIAEGRLPDGSATFAYFTSPTPGASNALPPPVLYEPQMLPGEIFRLFLEGNINQAYSLEVSGDLKTWTALTTLTCTNGLVSFEDAISNGPSRFYRVKYP
jgi:hypothetical protein